MKIANIDREIHHNFWTTRGVSMKFAGKSVTYDKIKSDKKPGFQPLFIRYIFWGINKLKLGLWSITEFAVNEISIIL